MDTVLLIAYVSILSPIVPIALSAFLKNTTFEIKVIRILLIGSLAFDISSYFFAIRGINTYPLTNFFFLFQALLLLIIYRDALRIRLNYVLIALAYSVIFLVNYFFLEGPYQLNAHSFSLSGVIFILLSLLFFRHLLITLPSNSVQRLPMVWINIAVLMYYSGNLFLFILNNYFTLGEQGNQREMWILHNVLNISKNLLFLIALWQSLRKINSSSS